MRAKGKLWSLLVHLAALLQQVFSAPAASQAAPPTASPLLVAAAEAAAGAALSKLVSATPAPSAQLHRSSSASPSSGEKPAIVSVHKLHRHINKASGTDQLHKFDLFIDPVCEQLSRLTDRQLELTCVQLRQISQHTSHALAKCFSEHGFQFDHTQNVGVMKRDHLADFCKAREANGEKYSKFSACASKIWTHAVDSQIDTILKERIKRPTVGHQSSAKSSSGLTDSIGLTRAEKSLIDDLVAHIHEEQVQEIASEIAMEHLTTGPPKHSTSSTAKPAVVVETIGKLEQAAQVAPTHTLVISANFGSPSSTTAPPKVASLMNITAQSTGNGSIVVRVDKPMATSTTSLPQSNLVVRVQSADGLAVQQTQPQESATIIAATQPSANLHPATEFPLATAQSPSAPVLPLLLNDQIPINVAKSDQTASNATSITASFTLTEPVKPKTTAAPIGIPALLSLLPVDNTTLAPVGPPITVVPHVEPTHNSNSGNAFSLNALAPLLPSASQQLATTPTPFVSGVPGVPTVSSLASFLLNSIDPTTKPPIIASSPIQTVPQGSMSAAESQSSITPPVETPITALNPDSLVGQPAASMDGALPLTPVGPLPIQSQSVTPAPLNSIQPMETMPELTVPTPATPAQPALPDQSLLPSLPLSNQQLIDTNGPPVIDLSQPPTNSIPSASPMVEPQHPSQPNIFVNSAVSPPPLEPSIPSPLPPHLKPPTTSAPSVAAPVLPILNKATILNVNKALEILNKDTTTTGRPESTSKPSFVATANKTITIQVSLTTRKPLLELVIKASTTARSQNTKTVRVKSKKLKVKQIPKIKTTTEAPSGGKFDLIELKKKFKDANIHEVIVVGDHVEGDDLLMDYEDHDEHHGHETGNHEDEHHSSDDEMVLEHEERKVSKEVKKEVNSKATMKLKRRKTRDGKKEKKVDSGEEDHSDHEHLLEGLKPGDVVHVDAGEMDHF